MKSSVGVSDLSLVLAFTLVLVSIGISAREKLGLTRDIVISITRSVVQLVIIGFILKYIIKLDDVWLTLAMAVFIMANAAWNAYKRDKNPNAKLWHSLVAITASTTVTGGVLIASGAIKFIPSQVIPIWGMIASNSMVAMGLCFRQLGTQFTDQRQQVWEKLALGAGVKLAAKPILRGSIKTAMQPTIDSAKTVGLVSLPGMMSGLIFAGIDPVYAIKYQIMVTFMLLSATGLGSMLAGYLSYRDYFDAGSRLVM